MDGAGLVPGDGGPGRAHDNHLSVAAAQAITESRDAVHRSPGDVVWFPPGEKHWHGATPTTAMGHIAIQEKLDSKTVEWLEHAGGALYRR